MNLGSLGPANRGNIDVKCQGRGDYGLGVSKYIAACDARNLSRVLITFSCDIFSKNNSFYIRFYNVFTPSNTSVLQCTFELRGENADNILSLDG